MTRKTLIFVLLVLLAALMLSGCGAAPRYWYSSQKDATSTKKDLFQCEEDAASFSRNMGEAGNKDVFQKRLQDCMTLRGYLSLTERDLPKDAPKVR
jgi:flagellar basal body-associated protein FliL